MKTKIIRYLIATALLVLIVIKGSFFDYYNFTEYTMYPSIPNPKKVLGNLAAYDLKIPFTQIKILKRSNPERGDVVLFRRGENIFLARIAGMPGENVSYVNKEFFVDGKPFESEKVDNEQELLKNYSGLKYSGTVIEKDLFVKKQKLGDTDVVYLNHIKEALTAPTQILKPDTYFTLSDNRMIGSDSRYFGVIHREDIVGKIQ